MIGKWSMILRRVLNAMAGAGLGLAVLAMLPGLAHAQQTKHTMTLQNVQRTYYIYQPRPVPPAGGWPVVIALHGGGGSGSQLSDQIGLNAVAQQNGFLAVYPDAVGNWNDGRSSTSGGPDDVAFMNALILKLVEGSKANPKRIYVTGISNGGMMTYRLACELGNRIAAVSPLSASMPSNYVNRCSPARPMPMIIFNSPDDPIMPWDGGQIKSGRSMGEGGLVIPVTDSVKRWQGFDSCGQSRLTQTINNLPHDGTTVNIYDFGGCRAPIRFVEIVGGGHAWPGAPSPGRAMEAIIGKPTQEINGSLMIWQTLSNYQLP